jgi:hypothetical protein
MFGIINPPNAYNQPSSVGMMMSSLAGQYPSTQAAMSYASNLTSNDSSAASWGMSMDMSGMPSWSQSYAAENVLYTQSFLAMNPEVVNSDGSIDFSKMGSNPVMLPTDVAASLDSTNPSNSTSSSGYGASSSAASGASSPSPSSSAVGASSNSSSSGAGALSSPRVAVALVAIAAAFFAL